MDYQLKKLPNSQVEITITEIDEKILQKYRKKAVKELSAHVKLPGFRPGHAPEDKVKDQFGEKTIVGHTLELAIPEVYIEILKKEELKPLLRPEVNITSLDPLKIEIKVALVPKIEIGNYHSIKVKEEKVEVSEKEVKDALEHFQKRMCIYNPVERACKKEDRLEIDFEGFTEDGVPLENTNSKNHPIVLGSKALIPGFEEELEGMKKGEEKEFPLSFPKEYP
ncbi:MAG TPA: trigger factor, partial [Candidatus Peregrinibacteria bacterium]|nr:trigger factor [Candidatus Peregrinibacteria bacterium]